MRRKTLCKLISAMSILPVLSSTVVLAVEIKGGLEEVVVTAQRRAESIQDVPIAMQAFSQDALAEAGVERMSDLGKVTPGLNMAEANNNIFPFIRGVGSLLQSGSTANSISIYLDDVYMPRLTSLAMEVGTLEQVQVLKGPQASLYGRNATGGAIVMTTSTAYGGDELSGKFGITGGTDNLRRVNGAISGSISNTIGFNLAGVSAEQDGHTKNLITSKYFGDDNIGSLDNYQVSGKLSFQPTDEMSFVLSFAHQEYEDSLGYDARQVYPGVAAFVASGASAQTNAATVAQLQGLGLPLVQAQAAADGLFPVQAPGDFQFSSTPFESYQSAALREGDFTMISFTADIDLSFAAFKSISSVSEQDFFSDYDILQENLGYVGFSTETPHESLSQEFRLTSTSDGDLSWVVGATYFEEGSKDSGAVTNYGGLAVVSRVNGTYIPLTVVDWDRESWAVYGDVSYQITDALKLTGGARYTEEDSTAVTIAAANPALLGVTQESQGDDVSWRVVADYQMDAGMFYGSVTKAFKAGGINSFNTASSIFDPESVLSYELGFKSSPIADTFTVNASVFSYDFSDVQVQLIGGASGGETFYTNGDEASIQGMDIELNAGFSNGLSVFAGATVLWDRTYDSLILESGGVSTDASGNDIAGAPELNAVIAVSYDVDLDDNGSLYITANGEYSSGYYFDVQNLVGTSVNGAAANSYSTLSLNVKYVFPDEKFSITAFGTNVLDEEYSRSGFTVFNGATGSVFDGEPAEYGVTLAYEF